MHGWRRWMAALLWLAAGLAPAQAEVTIRYALVSGVADPHLPYMLELLRLACGHAGERCQLQAASEMNQGRAMAQMQKQQGRVDLFWGMTSREREAQVLPVRIPLDKGLIGWRVALVPLDQPDLLAGVTTLPELARLSAGQVLDWPDTAILRHAGLPVHTTQDYANLFPMLRKHRFDYFPRSVIEVMQEAASPAAYGLVVDQHVAIHYPAAFYFFVAPHRPELAQLLTKGLEAALADGSFERTFSRFNNEHIRALRLSSRRIIHIANPLLPPSVPLNRPELWFRP